MKLAVDDNERTLMLICCLEKVASVVIAEERRNS